MICYLHNTLIHSCSQVPRVPVIIQGVTTEKHIGGQTGKTVVRKQAVCCAGRADTSNSKEIFFKEVLVRSYTRVPCDVNAHCYYSLPLKRTFVLVRQLSP